MICSAPMTIRWYAYPALLLLGAPILQQVLGGRSGEDTILLAVLLGLVLLVALRPK